MSGNANRGKESQGCRKMEVLQRMQQQKNEESCWIPQTPQKLEINLQKLTQNQKAYPITPEFGFAGAE